MDRYDILTAEKPVEDIKKLSWGEANDLVESAKMKLTTAFQGPEEEGAHRPTRVPLLLVLCWLQDRLRLREENRGWQGCPQRLCVLLPAVKARSRRQ